VEYDEFIRYFGGEMQGQEDGGLAGEMHLYRKSSNLSGWNDQANNKRQKGIKAAEAKNILGKKVAEQFVHVQKAFRSLDSDFSGCIGPEEFRRLLERYNLYMDDNEFDKWFKTLDPDGSGELTFAEFINIFGADICGAADEGIGMGVHRDAQYRAPTPKVRPQPGMSCDAAEKIIKKKLAEGFGEIRKAFRNLDQDCSGSIGPPEFRRLLERYGITMDEAEFVKFFRRFDPDGGGEVEYDEFVRYFGGEIQGVEDGGMAAELLNRKEFDPKNFVKAQRRNEGMTAEAAEKLLMTKFAEQFSEARKAFRSMDYDHSGAIGPEEFKRLIARYSIYMEDDEFQKLYTKIDPDGTGEIEYNEFIGYFGKGIAGSSEEGPGIGAAVSSNDDAYRPPTSKVTLRGLLDADEAERILKEKLEQQTGSCAKAFRSFDYDHSGSVAEPEFRQLLSRYCIYMTDKEFARLFRRFDPDGSGELDYEEFIKYFGLSLCGKDEGGLGIQLQAQCDFRKGLLAKEGRHVRSDPQDPMRALYCSPTGAAAPWRGTTPRPGTMAGMRPENQTRRPSSASKARSQKNNPPKPAEPQNKRGGLCVQGSSQPFRSSPAKAKINSRPSSARSRPTTSYGQRVRENSRSYTPRACTAKAETKNAWWD